MLVLEKLQYNPVNSDLQGEAANSPDLSNARDTRGLDDSPQIQGGQEICATKRMLELPRARVNRIVLYLDSTMARDSENVWIFSPLLNTSLISILAPYS